MSWGIERRIIMSFLIFAGMGLAVFFPFFLIKAITFGMQGKDNFWFTFGACFSFEAAFAALMAALMSLS